MFGVDRANRRGDAPLERPDRLVFGFVAAITLAGGCEAPVRLVDQVVTADPRLVLVARGELRPQRDGLALVFLALPQRGLCGIAVGNGKVVALSARRSEEHTSELQSLMRISYAVFCLKK